MTRSVLAGRTGSPGSAIGALLWVDAGHATHGTAAPVRAGRELDPAAEETRLRDALARAAADLEELARQTAGRAGDEVGAIFEAQALFARDPGIIEPTLAAIAAGASAAEAIDRVSAEQADVLAGVDDEYFRERAADLLDVGRRVSDLLTGRSRPELHRPDGRRAIVAADDLDPSLVAAVRPELVCGLAFAGGAPSGHAAIVARALGIPLVLGLGAALNASLDGRPAALDGDEGQLIVEPDPADLAEFADRAARAGAPRLVAVGGPPGTGANRVLVEANVGSIAEAELAGRSGADGVGLVRTELLFLGRRVAPGLAEQRSVYRRIAAALGGRPVTFRTLDVGGDKPAGFEPTASEANPALGVRGLRLGLRRPELFANQIRAILEAVPDQPARILLPMVSTVEELRAARAAIDAAAAAARADGAPISAGILVGVMVEVPALALVVDLVAPEVDFFSIGTNDLIQYTLAADRTNPGLAELASPLQPAILRLVAATCRAAAAHGRPVAVCGEAAADPDAAALFVGLGVDELSVTPRSIAAVRATLAGLDPAVAGDAATEALAASTVGAVRQIAARLRPPAAAGSSAVRAAVG